MYFSYHNRLKRLLETEDYICVKEDSNPFSYRFVFSRILKSMPIRKNKNIEYLEYIKGCEDVIINKKNKKK